MCSQFQLQKAMENNYQGDLADIFRVSTTGAISGGNNNTTTTSSESPSVVAVTTDGWHFPSHPINYSSSGIEEPSIQDFGDPFCNLRDPLFHDLDMMQASSSLFSSNEANDNNNNDNISPFGPKVLEEEIKRRPNTSNIFSRMLQISPITTLATMSSCNSPMTAANVALNHPPSNVVGASHGGALLASDCIVSPNSSKNCLVEQNSGLQISSPRNTGIKRRKSQAKKVVCIPAAAPVNSRQGGEVVPSDLWAWRKYGQKPIKGSPYPRGYYRCSSSKGCSARKQVERSRTDPNMLVITYTSEHNHPWPTQRNALAGSTRSQPNSKNTSTPKNNITQTSQSQNSPINTSFKEDEQKDSNVIDNDNTSVAQVNIPTCPKVKEETAEDDHINHHQLVEMHDVEFSQGIQDTYQPTLPADASSHNSHEDFFADLVELEADPLNLLFAKTLSEDIDQGRQKKSIDSFNLYNWSGNNNKDGSTSSCNNDNNNKGQVDP